MIDIVKLDAALGAFFAEHGQSDIRYVTVLWDREGRLIATNETEQQPLVQMLRQALLVVTSGEPDIELFAVQPKYDA